MPTALISVSDKTGLAAFATRLAAAGWELLASGGSARALSAAGLRVTEVASYTGSPEILGGRVKTLHPAIHGGILSRGSEADQNELAARGWREIDLVVANLYPFEKTVARPGASEADCIEDIDIGGVALLRAAAKNHARVTVLCDPADYETVATRLDSPGAFPAELRRGLAAKAFALCARYDSAIAAWMGSSAPTPSGENPGHELRYGENPHQRAWLFSDIPDSGPLGGTILQGKELSYNNLLDLDAAWRAAAAFDHAAAVVVKHLSPCGVAESPRAARSLEAAIACDPLSAFGGVMAVNREFDADCVRALGDTFVECIAAPSFTPEALRLLAPRKNARLLQMGERGVEKARSSRHETRSVLGGILKQEIDHGDPEGAPYTVVSRRTPTEAELVALRFARKACISARSNAILLAAPIDGQDPASGYMSVGIGSGQPNRVDSTRIAIERAGARARGAVLASDAFFPFPDSVQLAARAGISAIAQPGGSIRDADSIAAADAAGIAMISTGIRHFRH